MIDPEEVGLHFCFSIPDTIEFCAETLTGVNAHNEAMLLRALQRGNYDDAHRIVNIVKLTHGVPLFGPDADDLAAERRVLSKKYAEL